MDRTEAAVIFRTYAKKLYNTALRITASVPDAEGIMQETMIRYLTRAPRLDCEQKKYAWLRSTCVRLSIDWLRKTRKLVPIDSSVADIPDEETVADDGPDWQKMGADTVKDVMSAMESLAPGYRTVLILRLIEGYEYQEIARMMHLSESGVRSQYMRARRRLADAVRKMLDI